MNNGENLTNVGEIVGIVLTVLAIFIIVLSILVGIKRGMKKSLFRLGWLFVTALILWFVTPPISNLLNTIDLTSLNLDIMGPVHRLSDIGVNISKDVSSAENIRLFIILLLFWLLTIGLSNTLFLS